MSTNLDPNEYTPGRFERASCARYFTRRNFHRNQLLKLLYPASFSVDASFLIVLLETNPHYWASLQVGSPASEQDSLDATLRQLLVFLNGYLSLNKHNGVVLIAMHSTGCHYVYESSAAEHNSSFGINVAPGVLAEPIQMDACQKILSVLSTLTTNHDLDHDVRDGAPSFTPLAAALSMGLCYANSCHDRRISAIKRETRILCIQGSGDCSNQYVPTMNAIFSAQRAGIPIDSCYLGANDSAFLQQAAHITGGVYYKPRAFHDLLQHLLSTSGADRSTRRLLQLPGQRGVDFRASCFCHRRPLDSGFVCSVCLSIYCTKIRVCPTCGAAFDG